MPTSKTPDDIEHVARLVAASKAVERLSPAGKRALIVKMAERLGRLQSALEALERAIEADGTSS